MLTPASYLHNCKEYLKRQRALLAEAEADYEVGSGHGDRLRKRVECLEEEIRQTEAALAGGDADDAGEE